MNKLMNVLMTHSLIFFFRLITKLMDLEIVDIVTVLVEALEVLTVSNIIEYFLTILLLNVTCPLM